MIRSLGTATQLPTGEGGHDHCGHLPCAEASVLTPTTMRDEVEGVLKQLLMLEESVVSLDTIGDAIGAMYITQTEIEHVLNRLEESGKSIGVANAKLRENLHPVIQQAKRLKQTSGTNPSVSAIAEATQLSIGEVRAALLYASILGR